MNSTETTPQETPQETTVNETAVNETAVNETILHKEDVTVKKEKEYKSMLQQENVKVKIKELKDINLKTNNEPETLQELADFLLLQKEKEVPCEPRLLSKLVQDAKEGLKELLKNLKNITGKEITKEQVEKVAVRENFGIKGVNVARWQVKELDVFSEEVKQKIVTGRNKRREIQKELQELTNNPKEIPVTVVKEDNTRKEKTDVQKKQSAGKKDVKKKEKAQDKSQLKIQGFFSVVKEKVKEESRKSDYEITFLPFYQSNYVKLSRKCPQVKDFTLDGDVKEVQEYNRDKLVVEGLQFKLLKFYEDVRPPYFGTWSRVSKVISGKTPLKQDLDLLDYEYDSEAEWEEDEPGEELKSDDDLDDEEEIMDCEDDDNDGWVVPHGYLSDDEGVDGDHSNKPSKCSLDLIKHLADTTDLPKRAVLEQKVPIIIGIQYDEQPQVPNGQMLASCPIRILGEETFIDPYKEYVVESDEKKLASRSLSRKAVFPVELVDALAAEVLGTSTSLAKLVDDFKSKNENVKKSAIEQKIRDMFVKEKRGKDAKVLWHLKTSFESTPLKEKPNNAESILDLANLRSSPTPLCLGANINLNSDMMEIGD